MKKYLTITMYPYLFALIPGLTLYSHNIDQASMLSALIPLITGVILTIAGMQLTKLITKNINIRALATLYSLFVIFFHGHLHNFLTDLEMTFLKSHYTFTAINRVPQNDIYIHLFLLLIYIGLGFLLRRIVRKYKGDYVNFNKFFLLLTSVLLVFNLFNIVSYQIKASNQMAGENNTIKKGSYKFAGELPDIYYIILDGYARADVQKEYFHHDNSAFISFLKKEGFYVVPDSYANYAWTFLSLPSSLNFKHIKYLAKVNGNLSRDVRIPYEMIKKNEAARFLRTQGYTYVHMKSTWGATRENRYADIQINNSSWLFGDEFLRVFLSTTILKIFNALIVNNLADIHLKAFEEVAAVAEIDKPTFTFAHFIIPHHPYIFDSQGNVINNATLKDQFQRHMWADRKAYISQLKFVNKKVRQLIKNIIKKSTTSPIIVIQSDHGPQVILENNNVSDLARIKNFNSYHLPNGGNKMLYENITPVNTFRVIFNYYFGTDYKLLPDRKYYSIYGVPFKFREITDKDITNR